jgi:hypothetical protein
LRAQLVEIDPDFFARVRQLDHSLLVDYFVLDFRFICQRKCKYTLHFHCLFSSREPSVIAFIAQTIVILEENRHSQKLTQSNEFFAAYLVAF